ncbi:hypothetical protein EV679_1469 [Kerstersia gyiorum]|jgi:hypothetical protein|uniref:Uncharacterized protein n=1 Tax=Kerstersia gyiorum TaxID=206506 RepID=A0A4Q7MQI4_9BURK|nr:hypothetical protein [Kerstersia gyiorum]MCR4159902.1 hypothetical protein [Kerstersia gyiorum]RZS70076.1 hypothetical protein EV679_1469 [Kerstersia gyiorum]
MKIQATGLVFSDIVSISDSSQEAGGSTPSSHTLPELQFLSEEA